MQCDVYYKTLSPIVNFIWSHFRIPLFSTLLYVWNTALFLSSKTFLLVFIHHNIVHLAFTGSWFYGRELKVVVSSSN